MAVDVSALLACLAGPLILMPGPVDYPAYRWLAGIAAIMVAALTALFVLPLALGRGTVVVLTPDGIDSGLPIPGHIPWSAVVSLRAVCRLEGRQVLLTRADGTAVTLYAPWGPGWLPDPTFEREMAELRNWAARYGAVVEPDVQDRRRPAAVIAVAVASVLATAGVRAAEREVIWPWTPTASHVTAACPALQAAGLDRVWPANTRTRDRNELDRHELGESSYCGWVHRARDAPYIRLSAVVRRHDAFAGFSAINMAIRGYTTDRTVQTFAEPVRDLGDDAVMSSADDAFMTSSADQVLVVARRANVTVSVDVSMTPQDPARAETAAQGLTAAIIAGIGLGDQDKTMSQGSKPGKPTDEPLVRTTTR
ncbi:hypothetical protein DMB66_32805 [Actinoplanes sp. ATCC 53533]|nr:hypothetical protein DMB66_32805 [Actinoplanes sp. ATCC 53533]